MESVRDVKKRFKSIVTSLQKCVECPVCLETIKPPFKVCVRGHSVCLKCTTKLEKCPLCQEIFILENLVCMKSVLEALPRLCRYSDAGCVEVMEPDNDHEMFCGYRPIVCRYEDCSDKMPLVKFLKHCKTQHPDYFIIRKECENWCWTVNFESPENDYSPVSLFGNLFWILEKNDIIQKQLKIFFQATPIGKLDHDYYVRIEFKKRKFIYTHTLKAQVLSSYETKLEGKEGEEDDKNCMRITQEELSKLVDNKGNIHYSFYFFKK